MDMGGAIITIYVSSSFMEEVEERRGLPDIIHGRAERRRPELFSLELPLALWKTVLASPDGGIHLHKRAGTMPHDE